MKITVHITKLKVGLALTVSGAAIVIAMPVAGPWYGVAIFAGFLLGVGATLAIQAGWEHDKAEHEQG